MRQKKAKNFAEADKIRDDLKARALKLLMYAAERLETDLICTKEEL